LNARISFSRDAPIQLTINLNFSPEKIEKQESRFKTNLTAAGHNNRPPPQDHTWRKTISKVNITQSVIFEHTTDWIDVHFPTPGSGRPPGPVGNPPPDQVQTCGCDLDGDGLVNVLDAIAWLVQVRDRADNPCLDRNADGKLAINDLVLLLIDIKRGNCTIAGGN